MADEDTPLLPNAEPQERKLSSSTSRKLLIAGFLISLSFGLTQTPILYAFQQMVCEDYYETHPPFEGPGDRCRRNEIDSGAAAQFSIMSGATTFFAISNLFVSGWQMKKIGPRLALVVQNFFPVLRVSLQAFSLVLGGSRGIIVMQSSQAISIVGGPAGYILVLNTIIGEITGASQRTAMFGKLQGMIMVGNALGYLIGGYAAERFEVKAPFELAAVCLAVVCVYCILAIPYIDPKTLSTPKAKAKRTVISAALGPLRTLGPQKLRLHDGRVVNHYGITFLAFGIFIGVIATGYAPNLIQMYSMTVFHFDAGSNSMLMCLSAVIRGLYLMFIFPQIIGAGRKWFNKIDLLILLPPGPKTAIPTNPLDSDADLATPPGPVKHDTEGEFDLFFLRWSYLVDGIMTASAALATQGWHMYLVATLLPLASGSAAASKGVLTEMVPATEKADALQAMTVVECMATISTLGLFGFIFSALAEVGKSYLTFYLNGGIALVAICILLFSRFPPGDSELVHEVEATGEQGEHDSS